MDKLRFGVVGLGTIAEKAYLPKIDSLQLAEIASVCDVDYRKAMAASKQASVPAYDNCKQMLRKEKLDFIVALTPHDQYRGIVEAASIRGIHTFKEKPFATSLKEGNYYCQLSRRHRVEIATAVQRRVSPVHKAFLGFQEKLGPPFFVSINYNTLVPNAYSGWRAMKKQVGGCLFDMGYHMIDLLLWYFGTPKKVQAVSSTSTINKNADADDTAAVLFGYSNGLSGYLSTSRVITPKEERLTCLASKGIIHLTREQLTVYNREGGPIEQVSNPYDLPGFAMAQLDDFCKKLKTASEFDGARMHLEHVAVAEACYKSQATGMPISPEKLLNPTEVIANVP